MGRNGFGQLYHSPWGRRASRPAQRALGWIERRATHGRGPTARAAVRYLSHGMATGHSYRDAEPVLRVLYTTRDPRIAQLARAGLDRAWAAGVHTRAAVWHGIWELARHPGRRHRPGGELAGPLPAPARDFLLTPDPTATHEPKIRLVAAFDDDRVAWKPEARLVVEAALRHRDRLLAEMLGRTDQPDLLASIENAFDADRPLWTNETLKEILRANPVLPRTSSTASDPTLGVLLALVTDRPDLIDPHDPWRLFHRIEAALRTDLPADVAERLTAALREPGPMAEVIRRSAMTGDRTALAIWAETGGHTTDPGWRAAHLFWTRDWAAYDTLDPDGRLLREFLAGPTYDDSRMRGPVNVIPRFLAIAEEEGRPDPFPPPPRPRSAPGGPERYGGGSWPTGYTDGSTGHSGFGGHF